MRLGIFDSGFGGLSVLRHITNRLPQYDTVYLGDSARAPYGGRSPDEIYRYVEEAVHYLLQIEDCALVILACNSASADALRKIQRSWLPQHFPDRRVLGVLIPVAEQAAVTTTTGVIGVLATVATVTSSAYIREITKLLPTAQVHQVACPMFVPLIEAGEERSVAMDYFLQKYIKNNAVLSHIDTLILGCTHYGLIEDQIKQLLAPNIQLLTSGEIVTNRLIDYLKRHPEIDQLLEKNSHHSFLSTGNPELFSQHSQRFYQQAFVAEQVDITNLA